MVSLWLVVWVVAVSSLASLTTATQEENSPQFPSTTIDLKEIRQVNRKDDPQGIKQNIRVVIQPNESIPAYTTWTLYSKNSTNFVVYNSITLVNETCPPGEETTIEFEGTFVPSNITILHVTNNLTRDDVAFYYAVVDIEDLGTRVAWVGTSDDEVSYLRVETGTLDNVPVKDKVVCNQEDSPCYYPRTDLMDDLQIPRCKDLTAGDKTIKHCDDVIGQSQEMADTPTLLLQQEVKALGVTYKSNASSVQVIVSKPEDKNILSQIDCVTEGEDPQSCKATLSDEDYKQDVINNMVVLLNSDGYVTEAAMVRFEVYKISTAKLTGDAALVVWRHGTEGTYIVSASTTKEETKVTINCPASTDGTCRGHVVNVDLSEVPMVSVEKNDTSNSVQSTKITDTTPQKNKVTKLTQIIDTEQTTKSAITMASHSEGITKVTVAKLILVNQGDSRTYRETYYEGKVKDDGEFRFEFDDDILDGEGTTTMDFLAIGYKEDGDVGVVGPAYITLQAINIEDMAWVDSTSTTLRVATNNTEDLTVGNKPDNKCNSTVSPCYFEDDASLTKLLSLCLSLKNNIPGDTVETVQQCKEQQPTNFKELVNSVNLTLNEQETQNTMEVRTECTKEAKTLEVVAPGNDIKDCPLDLPTPCEVELNSHPPAFSVFVVCLQDDEVVLESKKETFQDLQVETKQLTKDLLEVRWITPNPESYKATVQATEALLINNNSPPLSRDAIPATEVSCNEKNMNCVAHFLLGTISSYTVTVQRKGDSSHIITKAGDMDSSFEPHTSIVTKVSKIDDGTTRVSLAAPLQEDTSSVQLSVVKESDITVEVTCKDGKMVPNSSSTYEFTHQDPVFIPGMLTKFFLVARGPEDALQSVGQVYLMVEAINIEDMAWVDSTSTTLRVATNNTEDLTVGNKPDNKCNSTVSPCYFEDDASLTKLLSLCLSLKNNIPGDTVETVQQCMEQQPTNFKELVNPVHLNLNEQKTQNTMVVRTECTKEAKTLEVVAPGNDIKDCPLDPPTPCEVELNSHPPAFSVFVVCLQDDEVVLESKKETFQDLQVETKQLTKDLLEVRWITPNPESYKATVQATEALLINNNSPPLSRDAIPATEVSCNEKNMNCVAHFLVGTISSYTVTVQRKGDSSHIITKAGDMDSSFEPHTSIVTKVSKIDDGTTRVSLAAALQEDTSSVQLSVVKESDITVEATCKDGKMVPNSSSTYEFTHQDPVFIPGMLTKFFLVARGREDALQSVGQVYLMVEELNDNLDWVGAEKHNTSASLRISPFDAEYHLPDKNKICLKGNTTCYFLQEGGQSNLNLERCKTLDNTASEVPTKVDECDENVTPFKEFSSHVSVTVESGKVNVILITDDSNSSSLEVIAYDPNDPSTVYTTENNVPCIINKDSHVCTRTIKNSGYSKPVNVLVVSFDENGAVKESALLISYFPGAPPTTTPNWVIVVSVLGSVFGLAFIAFITIFVVKKKRAHKEVQREIQLAYEKESTSGRDNEAYPSPRDSPIFIMPRDAPRISSRASPSMRAREEPRTSYQPSSHQQAGDEEYHSPDHKFQKQRDSVAPQPGNGDSRFRPQGRLPVVRVRPTPPPKPSPSTSYGRTDF
ncbi:uncharacterized protein LOC121879219 [Homarus americanus]|uniref:uncharacterized protein LOC121879219 n=1 Tax=Homarus americanus TaxID=6706 RepID=UPI001C445645|nr:uncharacterized protein LOC121879219 [Homarus americanus]XP_042241748.1 uncharacterized protein LOC121879219 [Homarus americanus]XP_042241749.1 uncharacterized protein LOC121879219 [Homarus americanus]